MNRRDAGIALVALLTAPVAGIAQTRGNLKRVGFLSVRSRPQSIETNYYRTFAEEMRKLGYLEGVSLEIDWRFADGKFDQLPVLAAQLVQSKVDVIVTAGTQATSAAQRSTSTIPIVMGSVADPVGSGLVKSLGRPGGNITGVSAMSTDIGPKQLEFLATATPGLSRIYILMNPANASHAAGFKDLENGARQAKVKISPLTARTEQEIVSAISGLSRSPGEALMVALDPFFISQARPLASLATKHRLPSISSNREFAEAGGLMSYGQSLPENYRRAARYVDKILKGALPADLPIEQPTTLELVVNRKTAGALGIKIPQELLLRADEVIE